MQHIKLKAYAKINLSIDVLKKRSDGYHDVCMVMQQVDLYDEVSVTIEEANHPLEISITTDMDNLPIDKSNIVYKAVQMLCNFGKIQIHLAKNIPMAAGLAGGSADAAAVLHALNLLLELGLPLEELKKIGTKLGADVTFCVMGQAAIEKRLGFSEEQVSTCALAEGIGEILTPLKSLDARLVLSKPSISVSTAEIYSALKLDEIIERPDTESLIDGLKEENFEKVAKSMFNVLEGISERKYPLISETKNIMREVGIMSKVMMSGSGPTVFAITKNSNVADEIYNRIIKYNRDSYLTNTI